VKDMAYTPTEWKTGDVITAPKLNNIEQGIVNAPGIAVFEFEAIWDDNNRVVTDVTVQDVIDAYSAGKLCVASYVVRRSTESADMLPKTFALFDYILPEDGGAIAKHLDIRKVNETTGNTQSQTLAGYNNEWTFNQESMNFTIGTTT
jgi:hypothetical protein